MMDQLIQTKEYSIIYGKHNDEENQELFRCPRCLENTDMARYINEHRSLVCPMNSKIPFIDDNQIVDLRNIEKMKYIGYYRMYYNNGWYGRWFYDEKLPPDELDCAGIDKIIEWFKDNYPKGCMYDMVDYFEKNFKEWGDKQRYLLKPFMSNHYKVAIDTKYGNNDYPVRIYVYHEMNKVFKLRLYKKSGDLDHEEYVESLQEAINRRTEWGLSIGLDPEPSMDFSRYPTIWELTPEGKYNRVLGY